MHLTGFKDQTKSNRLLAGLFGQVVLALALGSTFSLAAALDFNARYTFDIPAGDLTTALIKLAKQTNTQIMSQGDLTREKTPAVTGTYTTEQALATLLANTNLTYMATGPNTIAITQRSAPTSAATAEYETTRLARSEPISVDGAESVGADSGITNPDSQGRISEIIVTAQKRQERAFDVPISIVALGSDELEKRKITSIDDLSLAVPGLMVQSAGAWTRRIMLRGISNSFGNSSLIGLYLDEASATSGADLQLDLRTYDLERVEVLRGPQGTLYGEGSVGGTIRFITKNPTLDSFAMETDIAALFTEDGAPGQRVEAVVNVPLIESELGLRIAGTFDHQGGWIDQPAAGQNDINKQNVANIRVKGLWQPAPNFTVNAMAVIHRNNASTNTGEDDNGDYRQVFNQTTTPSVEDDYGLYNLTLTYDFPAVRVLSTTSYIEQDKEQRNYGYRLLTTAPPAPIADVLKPLYTRDADFLTEELRLTSSSLGPWQWTVGGFYRRARIVNYNTFYYAVPGVPGTPLPALFVVPNDSLSKSWAAFGDTSYKMTDRFTLGAGLRYFEDDQEYVIGGALQTGTFHALNPRVYAQYKLTDRVNTYASAAKGFRSGGFNNLNRPSFDAESVWTYELGAKTSLLEGRLSLDTALFYSDYKDYQISGLVGAFNITSNAGSARIQGIEWGLAWRPLKEWTLGFNGSYINSEFYEITALASTQSEGDSLDLFPKYGYTVSAQRDFRWSGKAAFARLDYNEHGRSTTKNRNALGPTGGLTPWYYSESDIINMLNFNLNLQWSDNLSLGVFAQNLLNDRGYIDPYQIEQVASRSRPRTYGIQFGVAFD